MRAHPLLCPPHLFSREEVLSRVSSVPKASGVYAWYFCQIPPGVPTSSCVQCRRAVLLYIGISPSAPPMNGKPPSSQSLWHRIRYHYRGNAEGSTLRLTLGCLLSRQLGLELRRVGSGKRMTFATGEPILSEWMARNAFVTFQACDRPWEVEVELVRTVSLPLNLDQNRNHAFHSTLTELRRAAKEAARRQEILGYRRSPICPR